MSGGCSCDDVLGILHYVNKAIDGGLTEIAYGFEPNPIFAACKKRNPNENKVNVSSLDAPTVDHMVNGPVVSFLRLIRIMEDKVKNVQQLLQSDVDKDTGLVSNSEVTPSTKTNVDQIHGNLDASMALIRSALSRSEFLALASYDCSCVPPELLQGRVLPLNDWMDLNFSMKLSTLLLAKSDLCDVCGELERGEQLLFEALAISHRLGTTYHRYVSIEVAVQKAFRRFRELPGAGADFGQRLRKWLQSHLKPDSPQGSDRYWLAWSALVQALEERRSAEYGAALQHVAGAWALAVRLRKVKAVCADGGASLMGGNSFADGKRAAPLQTLLDLIDTEKSFNVRALLRVATCASVDVEDRDYEEKKGKYQWALAACEEASRFRASSNAFLGLSTEDFERAQATSVLVSEELKKVSQVKTAKELRSLSSDMLKHFFGNAPSSG